MPSSLIRAALALLCAGAVVFGTALFPAALDVELQPSGPETVGSDATNPTESLPTDTGGSPATETPTPTPMPTETAAPPPDDTGDPDPSLGWLALVPKLFGLVVLGGLGYVGLVLLRAADIGVGDSGLSLDWLTLPSLPAPIGNALQLIPQVTTTVLLAGAAMLGRVAASVGTIAAGLGRGIASGLGPLGRMLGRSLGALPVAFGALLAAPLQALGSLGGSGGLLASLRGGITRPEFMQPDDPTTEDARAVASTPAEESDPDPPTLREAWEAMVELVPVQNPAATTPGEYARTAIDIGLPAAPVRRLTELFRAIEYGGADTTSSRTEAARDALDQIRKGGDE
ncbi:DUF4129 domain-containing protein [Haloarcula halophila]|uniref:DUF4129 domain-containing protein n=1 Tax=Haloarcula TaxID=2237 RepID=UPI0023E3D968|nr:DUF4129 domain-containing protein [Halomicroarcula sp. DFY41]